MTATLSIEMEDAPELAQKLIIPQTQSLLYGFGGNKAHSPNTIEFLVQVNPFNVMTEFCILDIPPPTTLSSRDYGFT